MIARVHVLLLFPITMLDGENYSNFEYEASGYRTRILQPQGSQPGASILYRISIDQRSAYQADVLIIDFKKDLFERSKGTPIDPDPGLILEVSNSFIRRLRIAARAAFAGELVGLSSFHIDYLDDVGSKLPKEAVRGDTAPSFQASPAVLSSTWARSGSFRGHVSSSISASS